jgi:hypothetical protein
MDSSIQPEFNQSQSTEPTQPAQTARLQQRLEAQEYHIQEQNRRLDMLENQLAEAVNRLSQSPDSQAQFIRLKNELLQTIHQQYGRQPAHQPEIVGTIASQLESHTQTLHKLQRELDRMNRHDEQITLARTEVDRINKTVATFQAELDKLGKQLTEKLRGITWLEQQRQNDSRQTIEIQAELPDLHKKIAANLAKVQLVEKQLPQFGKYEVALEELRGEMRQARERTDFQLADRERQMKKWADIAETQEKRIDEHKDLTEKYAEHYQLNKRALASLQSFQENLQREQHQSQEMQRLAEDRLWSALKNWQTDYEQRWKKQSTEWQPKVAELQKIIDQQNKQIQQIIRFNHTLEHQLEALMQIIEEDIHARTQAAHNWQHRFEQLANQQD